MTDSAFFSDKIGRYSVEIKVGSIDFYKINLADQLAEYSDTITSAEFEVTGDLSIESQENDDTTATAWLNASECSVGDVAKIKLVYSTQNGVTSSVTIIGYMVE